MRRIRKLEPGVWKVTNNNGSEILARTFFNACLGIASPSLMAFHIERDQKRALNRLFNDITEGRTSGKNGGFDYDRES